MAQCCNPQYWMLSALAMRARVVILQGKATVPSRLGEELETNPFLRPYSLAIRSALGPCLPSGRAASFRA